MMTLLIAAAALAETTSISTGPAGSTEIDTIVVEGRRSGNWEMPKLEYDEPASCPALVETEIPGFGVMRIRQRCASDQTEEWRPFHY
jgi:hypothetical protein